MKWPWVSRELYEAEREARVRTESAFSAVEHENNDVRHENQRLVDIIVSLKRDGFTAPTAPADVPAEPALPGAIEDALDYLLLDGAQRREHEAYARRWLAEGADAREVRRRLIDGEAE